MFAQKGGENEASEITWPGKVVPQYLDGRISLLTLADFRNSKAALIVMRNGIRVFYVLNHYCPHTKVVNELMLHLLFSTSLPFLLKSSFSNVLVPFVLSTPSEIIAAASSSTWIDKVAVTKRFGKAVSLARTPPGLTIETSKLGSFS